MKYETNNSNLGYIHLDFVGLISVQGCDLCVSTKDSMPHKISYNTPEDAEKAFKYFIEDEYIVIEISDEN